MIILVVLVCVATAVLFAWLLLVFASRIFGELAVPYRPSERLGELLGLAATPRPRRVPS